MRYNATINNLKEVIMRILILLISLLLTISFLDTKLYGEVNSCRESCRYYLLSREINSDRDRNLTPFKTICIESCREDEG
jgi:hypothetical protein